MEDDVLVEIFKLEGNERETKMCCDEQQVKNCKRGQDGDQIQHKVEPQSRIPMVTVFTPMIDAGVARGGMKQSQISRIKQQAWIRLERICPLQGD